MFTIPFFFVRSFRYTASYRYGYLDFQMYRGAGVGDYSFGCGGTFPPKPPPPPK